jgi:hypothetical protein
MPNRTASIAAVAVAATAILAAADARAAWAEIDCAKSHLFVAAGTKCQIDADVTPQNPDVSRGTRQHYWASGTHDGVWFVLFLQDIAPPSSFSTYTTAQAATWARNFGHARFPNRPISWGQVSSDVTTTMIPFRAGNSDCIAFDYAAPPSPVVPRGNHAWLLRGTLCPPAGTSLTMASLRSFLGAIRIGAPDANRSALGGPVAAWPGRPAPSQGTVPRPGASG